MSELADYQDQYRDARDAAIEDEEYAKADERMTVLDHYWHEIDKIADKIASGTSIFGS